MPPKTYTPDEIDTFVAFRKGMGTQGFDLSTADDFNVRHHTAGLTPLQHATNVINATPENTMGPVILQQLLDLGADPAMNIAFPASVPEGNKAGKDCNAIAYAASIGATEVCKIMYAHNPACISEPTGDSNMLNAFTAALMQLDNVAAPGTEDYEDMRQADCKALIRFFAQEGGYNVDTLSPSGHKPLVDMVTNDRPNAAKLLIELGSDPINAEPGVNIACIAAECGASGVISMLNDIKLSHLLQTLKPGTELMPLNITILSNNDEATAAIYAIAQKHGEKAASYMAFHQSPIIFAAANQKNIKTIIDLEITAGHQQGLIDVIAASKDLTSDQKLSTEKLIISSDKFVAAKNQTHLDLDIVCYDKFGKGLFHKAIVDEGISIEDFDLLLQNVPGANEHALQSVAHPQAPGGIAKVWVQSPAVFGVPVPRNAVKQPNGDFKIFVTANGNMWTSQADRSPFTDGCKIYETRPTELLRLKLEHLSCNLKPFSDNTYMVNAHWAVNVSAKTVHNVLESEPETVDYLSSFGTTPLVLAAQRFMRDTTNQESKDIIIELIHHKANVATTAAKLAPVYGAQWQDFLDLVSSVTEEMHTALHHDPVPLLAQLDIAA